MQQECYLRLQATNKLLADICQRHNLSNATVIDKDGNETPIMDIIADNVEFIKTGGWVNVDAKLPPKGQDVLICTSKNSSYGQYINVSFYLPEKSSSCHSDGANWFYTDKTEKIAYWQPLPQPPL